MADISQIKLPNGDTFDLIDEKSGYITAQYIENKTDYSIPVSRVGEIVVGKTAIGTDSTNFPTSKAVVDYVDERVVQEMDAIDVGVISVNGKTGSVTLSASDVGAASQSDVESYVYNQLISYDSYIHNEIPTSTSQLTNDSGFITSETDPTVPAWAKASTKPTYTASEVGALPSTTVIPTKTSDLTNDSGFITTDSDEKLKTYTSTLSNTVYYPVLGSLSTTASVKTVTSNLSYISDLNAVLQIGKSGVGTGGKTGSIRFYRQNNTRYIEIQPVSDVATENHIITLPNKTGTIALTSDIPSVYSSTNTGGYLTISTLPIYDGTVE